MPHPLCSWMRLLDIQLNPLAKNGYILSNCSGWLLDGCFAYHGAAFLLMLGHVPFGDVLLPAKVTHKRADASMFSQMHFQIWSRVVLFVTALKFAVELVDVLMCFFMVSQNPLLSELWVAAGVRAYKLLVLVFFMGCQVVTQMLGHLKTFLTVWVVTFIKSHGQMTLEVLTKFRIFLETFVAIYHRTLEICGTWTN